MTPAIIYHCNAVSMVDLTILERVTLFPDSKWKLGQHWGFKLQFSLGQRWLCDAKPSSHLLIQKMLAQHVVQTLAQHVVQTLAQHVVQTLAQHVV